MRFIEALKDGKVLVADGAMGTLLQAAGLPSGMIPEAWNLAQPQRILEAHRSYIEAGAMIILTNSFGANRIKLRRAGQEEQVTTYNRSAAQIARQAADDSAFVAGDIGPSGELMQPLGELTMDEARTVYAEQAGILAAAGVDLIVIETMSDLSEALAAIEGVQSATNLPVVCSMSFDTRLHTMMGVSPKSMVETCWPLGLAAVGGNCGKSLEENLEVVVQMRQVSADARLWMKANAGLPRLTEDGVVYDLDPEQFAHYALKFCEAGAQVIGGCCGSTPAHITAVRKALTAAGAL